MKLKKWVRDIKHKKNSGEVLSKLKSREFCATRLTTYDFQKAKTFIANTFTYTEAFRFSWSATK